MIPSVSGYVSVNDLDILFKGSNRPLVLHQTKESTQIPEWKALAPFFWVTLDLSPDGTAIGMAVEPDPETGLVERLVITRKALVITPAV